MLTIYNNYRSDNWTCRSSFFSVLQLLLVIHAYRERQTQKVMSGSHWGSFRSYFTRSVQPTFMPVRVQGPTGESGVHFQGVDLGNLSRQSLLQTFQCQLCREDKKKIIFKKDAIGHLLCAGPRPNTLMFTRKCNVRALFQDCLSSPDSSVRPCYLRIAFSPSLGGLNTAKGPYLVRSEPLVFHT